MHRIPGGDHFSDQGVTRTSRFGGGPQLDIVWLEEGPGCIISAYRSQRLDELTHDPVESVGFLEGQTVATLVEEFEAPLRNDLRDVPR